MAQLKDLIVTGPSRFVGTVYVNNIQGKISNASVADSANSVAWSGVTGKPSFATVATSGSYNDLTNKPTIPTNTNQLTNGAGFITAASIPTSLPANGGTATNAYNDQNGSNIVNTYATKSEIPSIPSSLPANGGNADTVDGQHFSYSNDADLPTWVWATNENGTSFLAKRANLSVNYANSAGSATDQTARDAAATAQSTANAAQSTANGKWTWNASDVASVKVSNAGYADSAGSIGWDNVSGKPTLFTGNGNTGAVDLNDIKTNGSYYISHDATNSPGAYGQLLCMRNLDTMSQLYIPYHSTGSIQFRGGYDGGGYYEWTTVLDDKNWFNYAAPASHTHSTSQITDFPTSLPANGGTATNAYNDQNGSNIVNTYATKDWVSSNFNYSTDTWRPIYDGVDSSATDTSASANAVRLAYGRADSAYNLAAGKQDAISDLSTIRSQASNGNTAYSWGNHANAGYLNTSSIITDSGNPIINNTVAPTEMISFNGLIGNGTVFSRNGSLFVADNPFMPVSTHWLDAWSDPDSYGGHNYRGQIELDLYPDRFYDFTYTPLISGIKINSIPGWNTDGLISHNVVRFRPGMGGFTLTVPSGIYWANGVPTEFENNNAMYELSFIRRGIDSITATWTKFTLE